MNYRLNETKADYMNSREIDFDDGGAFGEAYYLYRDCEKLKVFISSSMRDEGNFSWLELRDMISKAINGTEIFRAFAIEDHASVMPSRNYYRANVQQCDILVSIIRGELRPGTEEEIRLAVEIKKPLLLILIGENYDSNVKDIVRYVHSTDHCLTKTYNGLIEDLAKYIVRELNYDLVTIFRNNALNQVIGRASGVYINDPESNLISKEVLAAFGESVGLLSERYGYKFHKGSDVQTDPYLAPLGQQICSWIISGEAFSLEPYYRSILRAMEHSGISDKTLQFRLKALNAFINGDHEKAKTMVENARVSISNKNSWLYGNILIDKRNLALFDEDKAIQTYFDTQKDIEERAIPVVFPLATKYEKEALDQLEKSTRKVRERSPYTVVIHDSSLANALNAALTYVFVSVLYGSIASFAYGRELVAHILINYAALYRKQVLLLDGLKLLVLSGLGKEFKQCYSTNNDQIADIIKAEADELWGLTKKAQKNCIPRTKCYVIQCLASYFSDSVFEQVENALTSNIDQYMECREEWLKAINAIKLRINQAKLADILVRIISEKLYITENVVQKILIGNSWSSCPKDKLTALGNSIRENSEELLRSNVSLAAFGVLENEIGAKLLTDEQVDSSHDLEKANYCFATKQQGHTLKACLLELERQYRENNVKERHVGFWYTPENTICDLLNSNLRQDEWVDLDTSMERIISTMNSYKGDLSSLNAPIKVLVKYYCASKIFNRGVHSGWQESIAKLKHYKQEVDEITFWDPYKKDIWKVLYLALCVAAEITDSTKYLVRGVLVDKLDLRARVQYAEILEWLISSNIIKNADQELVNAVCMTLLNNEYDDVRCKAVNCLAACSERWGVEQYADDIYAATSDPSDKVVFKVLCLSKNHAFANEVLEDKIIQLLSRDANWFIRWHAEND